MQMDSLADWLGLCLLRAYANYTLMQWQARLSADFLLSCINGADFTWQRWVIISHPLGRGHNLFF